MNIFVENNGPYVYRSIFRQIPRLRQQQPVPDVHAGCERCPACGAPVGVHGHSGSAPAYTPAEPEYQPEPQYQPEPEYQPDPDPDPAPAPDPGQQPEAEPEPEPDSDSAPQPGPQQSVAYPDQQQSELQHPQQTITESPADFDERTVVPFTRVLEVFEFLFKTVDDALFFQPSVLRHISRAFTEGLASLGPQP